MNEKLAIGIIMLLNISFLIVVLITEIRWHFNIQKKLDKLIEDKLDKSTFHMLYLK